MTLPVRWTRFAASDLDALAETAVALPPDVKARFERAVADEIGALAAMPYGGTIGRVTATRELALPEFNLLAVYTVLPQAVTVLRLLVVRPTDFSPA